ncbi:cadherin-like domain-containing protein [Shewanella sp. SG41-4]|uniref:Ig-like domain-containing protein n=1 Tax=Shewanella sp. SG41-4 TaxID=2760976 RepID=UPI001602592C|nr:Ig-like domain-containing protein [Shewanella sp. SG41-4]MBB1437463.1 cadherin-like domain-containing protein [Shewanella sp. SG41-4]
MNTSIRYATRQAINNLAKPVVLISVLSGGFLAGCNSEDEMTMVKNSAPMVSSIMLSTVTEMPLTEQLIATDKDGDALTFTVMNEPTLGTVSLMPNGEFTYTPANEVTGMDSFTVAVTDGVNDPVAAMVNITIDAEQVMFSSLSRQAFLQPSQAAPIRVNGRVVEDDVSTADFYDDLLLD